MGVLILVVVDDGGIGLLKQTPSLKEVVLILVVVDDGGIDINDFDRFICLVLILVVVDDGGIAAFCSLSRSLSSLNPCCCG